MKTKLMVSMIALAATMVSLSGCKDDDDDDKKPSSSFTIDGSKKSLKSAFFMYDAVAGEGDVPGEAHYRHELMLASDGITLADGSLSGSGDLIFLAINGTTMNLDEGTYEFTGLEESAGAFEIWEAFVYLGLTIGPDGQGEGDVYTFTAGKVTVSKSKDVYTIKIEGTADGQAISGTYTGTVTSTPQEY